MEAVGQQSEIQNHASLLVQLSRKRSLKQHIKYFRFRSKVQLDHPVQQRGKRPAAAPPQSPTGATSDGPGQQDEGHLRDGDVIIGGSQQSDSGW